MKSSVMTIVIWVVLILVFVSVYRVLSGRPQERLSYAQLEQVIEQRQTDKVRVELRNGEGTAELKVHGTKHRSGPWPVQQLAALEGRGVPLVYSERESAAGSLLASWLPVLVVLFVVFLLLRKLRGGAAKLPQYEPELLPVPAPVDYQSHPDVRRLLHELAEAAKRGEEKSRRVLLIGPPGTGKTTLIRAAAADAQLQLLASAASEFVNIFIGAGAQRVRDLFAKAAAVQPVIVALEDLDGFGNKRIGSSEDGRGDERGQTLLEFCQWLDGLKSPPKQALIIATTSRPDLLDEALLRPGRFQVHVRLAPDGTSVVTRTDEQMKQVV